MAVFPKTEKLTPAIPNKKLGKNLLKAGLFKVNFNGNVIGIERSTYPLFLINPESWEENKSSNWVAQNIPGQSDPVHQWVSGNARTVNFTALVTNETSKLDIGNVDKLNSPSIIRKVSPEIASLVGGISTSSIGQFKSFDTDEGKLNITNRLNYYRSLLYPFYSSTENKSRQLKASPPLVVLFTGGAIEKIADKERVSVNTDLWFVSNLSIRITKQLSNLAPMEAEVSFQLTQYIIKPFGEVRFSPNTSSRG